MTNQTVADKFQELQALDAEVSKSNVAISHWAIYLSNSKASRDAMMLMFTANRLNEKLMKRLWLAERDAMDKRREVRIAQHEIEEWQFTALAFADPDSALLH
jgi:hypothetical protein